MDPLLILLFVVLFLLSGFFSGTELALMSLAKHKVDSLVKEKKMWSKALKYIKDRNDELLITILIWNNLVNTFTASLATVIATDMAVKSWIQPSLAIWIATWVITFLLLVFWEIAPKSFATKNAEKISLWVAKIYKVLMFLLYPIVKILEAIIKLFTWKARADQVTWEEIEAFIDMWKDSWWLECSTHKKMKSILDFENIDVEEIMTPRVKLDAISIDSTIKEAKKFFMEHTHSRIMVYEDTIDKINYYYTIRDLLKYSDETKTLREINLREPVKIPLNKTIENLFAIFQKQHKILAVILDEYGWVAWIVTLEDIVEEVFWEIRDETDKETDEIREIKKDNLIVESSVLAEEVLASLSLKLENIWLDQKEFEWETLSYIITEKLERFPKTWEVVEYEIFSEESEKKWKLVLKFLNVDDSGTWNIEIKKVEIK